MKPKAFNYTAYTDLEADLMIAKAELEQVKAERDAAINDLKGIMICGGRNIDTCDYCNYSGCYARGGDRLCSPEWRGPQKEEIYNDIG